MYVKRHNLGKSKRCAIFRIYTEFLQLNKEKMKQLRMHIQPDTFHFATKSALPWNCLNSL